jgi:hypothetical protein
LFSIIDAIISPFTRVAGLIAKIPGMGGGAI